jgi:hypothetical protein
MRFFAVEVTNYPGADGSSTVLVPRSAFVPSWILEPSTAPSDPLASAPPEFHRLLELMDAFATELGLRVNRSRTGRNYQPHHTPPGARYTSGIGLYASGRGVEVTLAVFRDLDRPELADELLERIAELTGTRPTARDFPSFDAEILLRDWERSRRLLLEPYFDARDTLAREAPG